MATDESGMLEIARGWNRCHGAFYQLRESDLLWNLREQELVTYKRGELAGVSVIWAEPRERGVAWGMPPRGLWLSLYGEIREGGEAEFAGEAERFARESGRTRLGISGDEFHFLPGIPVDEPAGARLAQAFAGLGFKSSDCADYVGGLEGEKVAAYMREAVDEAARRGWTLREVGAEGAESEELLAFLEREFKGRWPREWRIWRDRQDTARAFWSLLRDEKGAVLGFSRLALRGKLKPAERGWTPGAIRLPLAAGGAPLDTDSCLGPIGISAAERGRGAGKILLGLSLHALGNRGAKLTCIDWTNAYNYYAPLNFQVVRKYLTVWKEF